MKINKPSVFLYITLLSGLLFYGCTNKSIIHTSKEKQNIAEPKLVETSGLIDEYIDKYISTNYEIIYKTEEIPEDIRKFLLNKISNENIANPNENFNPSDVIVDTKIPQRRLVFAGNSSYSWFVCYEQGGRGYHCHLLIFSIENKKMKVMFNGAYFYKPQNPNQLKQWVEEHKFKESECW